MYWAFHFEGSETVAGTKSNHRFFPGRRKRSRACLNPPLPTVPLPNIIEKKGEGIQHVAFRVENIEAALEELKAKGIKLIDEKPRNGAGGAKIAFLHPKSTSGILVELCQRDIKN